MNDPAWRLKMTSNFEEHIRSAFPAGAITRPEMTAWPSGSAAADAPTAGRARGRGHGA